MEKNLTTGSVGRQLIGFSLPYLLSYLLQTLYGMADLFIIGQYEGVAGTTAVAVGSQVMHMLTVMIVGLAMGTTVSIARAIGADDRPQAAAATGNTVTLFLSLSLVLTAGLLLLRRPITAVMSTPEAAVEGTIRYLTICFLGVPCITAYNILSAIFRGMGDSKSPMIFIFIACLANIALDYLFIGALHLGPAGAALGTSLSQAISVAISLAVIVHRRTMPLAKADLRPQKPVMDAILKIGVPISVQDKFIQISFIVITVIANRRGLTDAAAVGIVEKIIGFLFLVPSSMLSAVSALGAQNLGAGKPERAKQTLFWAIGLACGFGAVTVVAMQFLAEALVGLFTPDQAAVLAGGQYLRGYIWDSFFAGVQFSFSGYFCACGRSGLSFLHNFLSIVCVRIPGAYLTSRLFPQTLLPMGLANAAGSLFSICARWICPAADRGLSAEPRRGPHRGEASPAEAGGRPAAAGVRAHRAQDRQPPAPAARGTDDAARRDRACGLRPLPPVLAGADAAHHRLQPPAVAGALPPSDGLHPRKPPAAGRLLPRDHPDRLRPDERHRKIRHRDHHPRPGSMRSQGSPPRGAGSAQPRLRGCHRFA